MKHYHALGRMPKGEMNKTETEYAQHLELLKRAGEILNFKFEPLKLSLAKNTTYTPDFMVINKNREIELHEVKGFWKDDARVKTKVAQATFPYFVFVGITKNPKSKGGGWNYEYFRD
ncbi:hypothetical protein AAX09_07620 [Moraxella bovoculi]|uniref:DUF1064 domain-containing protein n=1 Tax=Moraxella bovoculi TaxID=386891 RepID=UPI000624EB6A|nr:DUF1064 domain-containing protein [Moraxella bovoculi]AKG19263.1 hypothetical protein AAX09_07620 [Moraxella bovoculi]